MEVCPYLYKFPKPPSPIEYPALRESCTRSLNLLPTTILTRNSCQISCSSVFLIFHKNLLYTDKHRKFTSAQFINLSLIFSQKWIKSKIHWTFQLNNISQG